MRILKLAKALSMICASANGGGALSSPKKLVDEVLEDLEREFEYAQKSAMVYRSHQEQVSPAGPGGEAAEALPVKEGSEEGGEGLSPRPD